MVSRQRRCKGGWTLPGVFGLGALQVLLKASALRPSGPVVLAGSGPLLYLVAAELAQAGATIAAVVDSSPWPGARALAGLAWAPGYLTRAIGFEVALRRRRIPILRRHAVIAVTGEARVESVAVAPLDRKGRPHAHGQRRIGARTLGMGFGLTPNTDLTRAAGAAHDWDAVLGGWHPRRNADAETTVAGLFAAGDGAGIGGREIARAEGILAASGIVRRLGHAPSPALSAAEDRQRLGLWRHERARRALGAWAAPQTAYFALADPATLVCRCEGVRAGQIADAIQQGLSRPGPLKLATRAGLGFCQGRVCASAVAHLAALAANASPGELGPPSARFPIHPVPADAFAKLGPESG